VIGRGFSIVASRKPLNTACIVTDNLATPGSYWSTATDDLLAALGSTPEGLSAEEAGRRLSQIGPNVLEAKKKATALGLYINQFKSPIILILLSATGVSAVLKDWNERPRSFQF
jgi:magnesium-transporting ATPase (P-type)